MKESTVKMGRAPYQRQLLQLQIHQSVPVCDCEVELNSNVRAVQIPLTFDAFR